MSRLTNLIKETLSTPIKDLNKAREPLNESKKKDCNCGCNTCDNVGNEGILLNENIAPKQILSENLQYHVHNKLPLTENTFRYGSESFINLWAEARSLYLREIIHVNDDDKEILTETDLGNYGIYENLKVPLDMPLSVRANEVPLMNILRRAEEKGQEGYPFYRELADELRQESIDLNRVKEVLRDYGVYFEYEDLLSLNEAREPLNEAKKKKKKDPPIGKPKRGGSKAYYVYVRDPKTKKVKKISFGSGGLKAKINNKKARNAFAARHKCSTKTDKTKAGYWSCRLPRYAKLLGLKSSFSGFW